MTNYTTLISFEYTPPAPAPTWWNSLWQTTSQPDTISFNTYVDTYGRWLDVWAETHKLEKAFDADPNFIEVLLEQICSAIKAEYYPTQKIDIVTFLLALKQIYLKTPDVERPFYLEIQKIKHLE
jgi:hypothetical protein